MSNDPSSDATRIKIEKMQLDHQRWEIRQHHKEQRRERRHALILTILRPASFEHGIVYTAFGVVIIIAISTGVGTVLDAFLP